MNKMGIPELAKMREEVAWVNENNTLLSLKTLCGVLIKLITYIEEREVQAGMYVEGESRDG